MFTLKNRLVLIEFTGTGKQNSVLLEIEDNSVLVVTDAESYTPSFVYRIQLNAFPSEAFLEYELTKVSGKKVKFVRVLDRNIHLDSSVLSGLRKMPVDIFDNDYLDEVKNEALVLCVDIRNFSSFLCANPEDAVFSLIKDFTSNFLSCVNQFAFGCSYYKLLGDGALVIWDQTDQTSVGEALQVFDTFTDFVNEELFKPCPGLGFAGALVTDKVFKYEISAEASQLKYRDYVGYGINLACRLQALARRDELIVNRLLASTGFIPYEERPIAPYAEDLHHLKGLKTEDSSSVFFYAPTCPLTQKSE